jgi:hypothetical protein
MQSSFLCQRKTTKVLKLAEGGTGIQTCLFIPLENSARKRRWEIQSQMDFYNLSFLKEGKENSVPNFIRRQSSQKDLKIFNLDSSFKSG